MKVTDYIVDIINRFPKGYVFTYEDFSVEVNKKEAVIKALNRMAASGRITKLSKGKYYKPEKTVFGELVPEQYQIVKDILEDDGKIIGYLTGLSIYNKLGLTTQVSNTIQIGKNEIRPTFSRGRYTIAFIKQKNTITKENIPLLQLLDAIRYIKKIPDTTMVSACRRLFAIIKDLPKEDLYTMVRLSKKYPPSTRALLGAILDELGQVEITEILQKTLNSITSYKFPGINTVLSNTENWNIK
ncbi:MULTISPECIES: DUF6088 family protein [Flavobacteriaceae]|uniref:AbiEi antitoxin C-terminal domain-containing protein n=1 Tax=Galbibacter orientalis DSM 19592 TaxID=926559 RepID=I3C0Z1_9FLAO|nr:DUF6088 family protein [Galbibacter orientalis]EIJ37284.1 hypothetical protein JoomaDRAFT_0225 [Galbibacter orientalis DSM 19592]